VSDNRADAQLDELWPTPAEAVSDNHIIAGFGRIAGRPWLSANFVSSVDGAVSVDGKSGGLGGPADKRMFDLLRRPADAILVGAGTVRDEGYGPMVLDAASVDWRLSSGLPAHPAFAIVSGRLDLDPASRIFTEAPVRPVVVTLQTADAAKQAELATVADVLIAGETELDPHLLLRQLHDRGLMHVHSEGGPSLFGSLVAAGVLDELALTLSPLLAGGDAARILSTTLPAAAALTLASVHRARSTLLMRYCRPASEGTEE
jgi:riboflavin-specific deaminase-like protein